jgi:hypothetical protein
MDFQVPALFSTFQDFDAPIEINLYRWVIFVKSVLDISKTKIARNILSLEKSRQYSTAHDFTLNLLRHCDCTHLQISFRLNRCNLWKFHYFITFITSNRVPLTFNHPPLLRCWFALREPKPQLNHNTRRLKENHAIYCLPTLLSQSFTYPWLGEEGNCCANFQDRSIPP